MNPFISCNEHEEIYTLGMQWNIADDAFQYAINIINAYKVSKQNILSTLFRRYLTLELLGPITLSAKLYIQRVFDSGKNQVNQQDELVVNVRKFSFIGNQTVRWIIYRLLIN